MRFSLIISTAVLFVCLGATAHAAGADKTVTLNDITVLTFIDAHSTMGLQIFPGLSGEKKEMLPEAGAPAAVNVFVVKTGGKRILIDAGWGKDGRVVGQAPAKMVAAGILPADIDIVLLTHMHGDHITGLLDGGKPVYTNATIMLAKPELDAWVVQGKGAEGNVALARAVAKAYGDRVQTFDFGTTVAPGIVGLSAVGHTPGHTAYQIASGDAVMLVAGDFLHATDLQAAYPDVSSRYDMNPEQAAATRADILKTLAGSSTLVAGMHIPDGGVGKVAARAAGGYSIEIAR